MLYYSLKKNSPPISFKDAVLLGQAPDGGLYFPENPTEANKQLGGRQGITRQIVELHPHEFATQYMLPYVTPELQPDELHQIIDETLSFPLPLVRVSPQISILELFHGPTMAFKDVGARFMSRCLSRFVGGIGHRVVVLVATSGDTGGAVAHGFSETPGVDVVILYPSGKLSQIQERQITETAANIHPLEVLGNFDDCQRMVKLAFSDSELRKNLFLTSANSINVARWLPQQLYYLSAYRQWNSECQLPPVWCVPSGNFGNMAALLLTVFNGIPARKCLAACNQNDTVPRFLAGQPYEPMQAVATLSNAMDVANPSNFPRIQELFKVTKTELNSLLNAGSIDDKQTKSAIKFVFEQFGYLLDPHTAVGWVYLSDYLRERPNDRGILLATAHPSKFPEVYRQEFGWTPQPIVGLSTESVRTKKSITMPAEYDNLRSWLMQRM